MKRIALAFTLAFCPAAYAEQNTIADLIGVAQAAAGSSSAKSLAGGILPPGSIPAPDQSITSGAVVQGGKIVAGSMPMALVCKDFQQPNACADDGTAVPFEKYIIKKTGETSFVIERIEVNTNQGGTAMSVTLHFHLTQ